MATATTASYPVWLSSVVKINQMIAVTSLPFEVWRQDQTPREMPLTQGDLFIQSSDNYLCPGTLLNPDKNLSAPKFPSSSGYKPMVITSSSWGYVKAEVNRLQWKL